ncbi:hypothetical protein GGI16_002807 [Coemansia sp. S142-1]|nr:hypothetical protein GGI16_002807 [Coemansia sp. S142-1]
MWSGLWKRSGCRIQARAQMNSAIRPKSLRCISTSAVSYNKQWDGAVGKFRVASKELLSNSSAYQSFGSLKEPHKLVLTKMQELSDLIDLAVEQDDTELKQYLLSGDIEEACTLARELYLSRLLHGCENADAAITITAGAGGVDSCDWTQMLATMYKQCRRGKNQSIQALGLVQ